MSSISTAAGILRGLHALPSPLVLALLVAPAEAVGQSLHDPYAPAWSAIAPLDTEVLAWNPALSAADNGELLRLATLALVAGDRLEVGPGLWSVAEFWNVTASGTAAAPIRIVGAPGAVITRPDAGQNVINFGSASSSGPAAVRFLSFEGFEIYGGSYGIRLWDCSEVWLRGLHVHHVGDVAISANTVNTSRLFITDCHIHDTGQVPGALGEGLYLGGNSASVITRGSIIARNHIHHTGGGDGDGIELKQGSFDNLIVENDVHHTQNPCILAYGTGGATRNRIVRNRLWASSSVVLQVQGEALVSDNLIVSPSQGFESHDHQGLTRDLELVHNTILAAGDAAHLDDWQNRPGMVCANNALYSLGGIGVEFVAGSSGITIAGNVVVGPVIGSSSGWIAGNGLSDFVGLLPDASSLTANPSAGSALLGAADASFATTYDLAGLVRPAVPSAGCAELGSYGHCIGAGVPGAGGRVPRITSSIAPALGLFPLVRLDHARAHADAFLFLGFGVADAPFHGGLLHPVAPRVVRTTTNAAGRAFAPIAIPQSGVLSGTTFVGQWAVLDAAAAQGVALSQGALWQL